MKSDLSTLAQQNSTLTEDLLWRILSVNADMDQKSEEELPALTTLRRASQVSASWRELVLFAPSLWGKVISLNHLNQKTGLWRDEVLQRTGKSLLHVKGKTGSRQNSANFFASILTAHWPRIRSLDLDMLGDIGYIGLQVLVAIFDRPAPFLENFSVPVLNAGQGLAVGNNFRLFFDEAPSLRRFSPFSVAIPSHIGAPWMPQLHSLCLMHPVSARRLLDALANMPVLEEFIVLSKLIEDPQANSLPTLTLPRLNRISVDLAGSTGWINILSKVTPATACSLRLVLVLRGRHDRLTTQDMSDAYRLLSYYSQRYFNTRKVFSVDLLISKNHFELNGRENVHSTAYTDMFTFSFGCISSLFPGLPSPAFLDSLNPCHWNTVKILNLSLDTQVGLSSSDEKFIRLVSSLTSLQSLIVVPETLQLLLNLPEDVGPTIFPCLRKVRYCPVERQPDSHILAPFLIFRGNIGLPIEEIELFGEEALCRNFEFLDDFIGLKVIWWVREQRFEYYCGDGEPEVLDFASYDYDSDF